MFDEKWQNQRGKSGFKYESETYRPTIKVNNKKPLTFKELTTAEINKAREKKKEKGRVNRFRI